MPPSLDSTTAVKGVAAGEDPLLWWIEHQQEQPLSAAAAQPTPAPPLPHDPSPTSSAAAQLPAHVQEMEFEWNDIHILRPLGTGSFGKVFLAKWRETPVAVKVLVDTRAVYDSLSGGARSMEGAATPVTTAAPDKLLEEVALTAGVRHPNVVNFLGFCITPPCVAVEFCPRGSLFEVLHAAAADPAAARALSWRRRVCMAADAAAGMLHLHTRSPPLIHRDLKSPNLLVSADWTVKVADMGLSKLAAEATHASVATSGGAAANPRWLAPEVLAGGHTGQASDVYAFGVVMWELITWELPWGEINTWAVVGSVQQGLRPALPAAGTARGVAPGDPTYASYVELMQRCWAQDPAARPTFAEVAQTLRRLQGSTLDAV